VLDISELGYSYEQPETQPELMMVEAIRPASPFTGEMSPFWADLTRATYDVHGRGRS